MFALDFTYVCTHCISSLLGYDTVLLSNMVFVIFLDFFSVCLFVRTASVLASPSSDHLFQGQLFGRLTGERCGRLLPRSISSKWSKGEFALLAFSCTVAVLTFNCLSVFSANSHLVPDNCAIPGHPCLAAARTGAIEKRPSQLNYLCCYAAPMYRETFPKQINKWMSVFSIALRLSLMQGSPSVEILAKLGVRLVSKPCSLSYQSTEKQTLRSTFLQGSLRRNRRESDCVKLNIPS